MPLTATQRKESLERGAQKEIAAKIGWFASQVSAAVSGEMRPKSRGSKKKLRRCQIEVARLIGVPLDVAFSADELAVSELPGVRMA
ncbi:MAG TPA: hypothetical protein VKH19_07550 [Gemmatimonadaceae bacterium]|nr:hypothetical protein [Gemmatimonadaceae bacterium]